MKTAADGAKAAARIYGASSRYGNPIATCKIGEGLDVARWREALALAYRVAAGAVEAGANPMPEVRSPGGTIAYVTIEADDEADLQTALTQLRAGLDSARGAR